MNTFHDFTSCIYTTQGQVLCNKPGKDKKPGPMIVENFAQINQRPNESMSTCTTLSKKLSEAVSGYKCSSIINNSPPNCDFQFKCAE